MDNPSSGGSSAENTSGQGKGAVVPVEIQGWNWGAFLLNWIWGLGNGTYIALLALIPMVNVVMVFVLGAKGTEWAWQNKRWDSIESFKRTQRKWLYAGLVVFGIGMIIMIVCMVGVFSVVFHAIGAPQRTADMFIMDIAFESIGQAYALTDPQFQEKTTESQFANFINSDTVFRQMTGASFYRVSVDNSSATLWGTASAKDGSSVRITVSESEENGSWKISGITEE
jgi:hypothetical protein